MPKYKVTLPTPDGDSIESIWEYDMDSEAIWSLISYSYKEEYGEYPTDASIELIGDDDDA